MKEHLTHSGVRVWGKGVLEDFLRPDRWRVNNTGVGGRGEKYFLLCVKHSVQKCPEDTQLQYNLNSLFKFLILLKSHFDFEIHGMLVMLLLEAT